MTQEYLYSKMDSALDIFSLRGSIFYLVMSEHYGPVPILLHGLVAYPSSSSREYVRR